jgi:hypothetical protein
MMVEWFGVVYFVVDMCGCVVWWLVGLEKRRLKSGVHSAT